MPVKLIHIIWKETETDYSQVEYHGNITECQKRRNELQGDVPQWGFPQFIIKSKPKIQGENNAKIQK